MPKLIVQSQDREWVVELKEGSNVVGRSSRCSVPVADPNISREHCEIVLAGGVATLFDKGSMNGTSVNGKRVWEHRLLEGDKIQIIGTYLWYEKKEESSARNAPVESAKGDSKTRTRRREGGTDTRRKPGSGSAVIESPIAEFAVWTKPIFDWRALLPYAGGIVGLLAVGFLLLQLIRGERPVPEDVANAFPADPGLEASPPGPARNWRLAPSAGSSLSISEAVARTGRRSLEVSKGADPQSGIVDVELRSEIRASAPAYTLTAWAKFGSFTGSVALKVSWIRDGAVYFEEYSSPTMRTADWASIELVATRPPGAQALRVGVRTLGRGGQVNLDDFRLVPGSGEGPGYTSVAFAPYRLLVSKGGGVCVGAGDDALLNNIHFGLENDREGKRSQLVAAPPELRTGKGLRLSGRVAHPVEGREIRYELSVEKRGSQLWFGYRFPAGELKQVDRIVLQCVLPRSVSPKATASKTAFEFRAGGKEYALGFSGNIREVRRGTGGRLLEVFDVAGRADEVHAAFRLVPLSGRDPLSEARGREKDKPGEALALLLSARRGIVLGEEGRRLLEEKIAQLQAQERREWSKVEGVGLSAEFVGHPSLVAEAGSRLSTYKARWAGASFGAKIAAMRERLEGVEGRGEAADRAQRLLAGARGYYEAGKGALAELILRAILAAYSETPAAAQARELLKTIRSAEER